MPLRGMRFYVVVLFCAALIPSPALAESAPDRGRAFEPTPLSRNVYGIAPPSADPRRQRAYIEAADGTRIFTETWLPKRRDGQVPPRRVPTVAVFTPYATIGALRYEEERLAEALVPYGYAYTQVHVRGSGESGGCLEFISERETDDAARVVRHLAREAPWSNGVVGGIGHSYDGGSVLAVAGSEKPWIAEHLKAIVALAPAASFYDLGYFDGVPYAGYDPGGSAALTGLFSVPPGSQGTFAEYLQRFECQPVTLLGSLNPAGNFTAFAREREYRDDAEHVTAATLMVHGHADGANVPLIQTGLFDRLPDATPKAGVFGVFWHEWPHHRVTPVRPEWERRDFLRMVRAWFDRYLRGLPTGAGRWPTAQVQGTDGQWRAEPEWPRTGDRPGRLALGADGALGAREPTGATSYVEGGPTAHGDPPPGTQATFTTPPLPGRLELTGQPYLDLFVSLSAPDAHLAAEIEALGAAGEPIPFARTAGFRSMQHLAPLRHGRFTQSEPVPPPTGTPIHVKLRLMPTDLVVPRGGRLRVTIAGSLEAVDPIMLASGLDLPLKGPSQPSGSFTQVTILHDCAHPSTLRFDRPRRDRRLLNVREPDEAGMPLASSPGDRVAPTGGGGIASGPICS